MKIPRLRLATIALALAVPTPLAFQLQAQSVVTPPPSTAITNFAEESRPSVQITYPSKTQIGDLWPSCWSDDGNLYAANGDGTAFNGKPNAKTPIYDMAISRITGNPAAHPAVPLAGTTVSFEVEPSYTTPASANNAIGVNYTGDNSRFNDKPTGMLCVGGDIYLAYQNLGTSAANFTGAPAATILRSRDHGQTWSAPPAQPMFGSANPNTPGLFTTIFFLDMGQDPQATGSPTPDYIYAYGLDTNWTAQTKLFLARIPYDVSGSPTPNHLLQADQWQFFSGMQGDKPTWHAAVNNKVPVLTDTRDLYKTIITSGAPASFCPSGNVTPGSETVIAQGGVTYDAPLKRYIFSTWSCATHEFYDAPNPWGPWTHIATGGIDGDQAAASKDFGVLLLPANRGQYATTIPSKFISKDGKTVYLQSNVAEPVLGQSSNQDGYTFSLRKVFLQPPATNPAATNLMSATNLATMPSTFAISKSTHFGQLCGLNCSDILTGSAAGSEDDYDDENKAADGIQSYWGYTWPTQYNINQVVYTTGGPFPKNDGGWFGGNLTVQVRQFGQWVNASGVVATPAYPYDETALPNKTYTFNFSEVQADGVRIIGDVPSFSGSNYFTSISNLGVYFNNGTGNLVADPGFEGQTTSTVSAPWSTEGPDLHGIDLNGCCAHTGSKDAFIRDSTSNFNSIIQVINVTPNTNYNLTAFIQNNFPSTSIGYIGVRNGTTPNVLKETTFSSQPTYAQTTPVLFNSGTNTTVTLYIGFFGDGQDQYIQIDDVSLTQQ